ncbi:MAG: hypothetical protein AAF721_20050 [Myxococcota bacterium]
MSAILAVPPEVTIRTDPPPEPGGIFSLIALLCVVLIVTVVLRRALRGKRGANGLFAFSVGVGNALMEMGAMLQPDRANVESIQKAEAPGEDKADVGDGRLNRPRARP